MKSLRNNVAVVISTFNGSKWIVEQLNSIIAQNIEIKFYIRDDGSQDNTIELIKNFFLGRNHLLKFFEFNNKNIGVVASFNKLLMMVDEDYIFLCDQDDVWLPGRARLMLSKLIFLEESIVDQHVPLLICSDAQIVDSNLNIISNSFWKYMGYKPNLNIKLNHALLQNFTPGCAMLLNKNLIRKSLPFPENIPMHDWWLLLIGIIYGKIELIQHATLKYRQHNFNAVGANKVSFFNINLILKKIRLVNSLMDKNYLMAHKIRDRYCDIPSCSLNIIDNFIVLPSLGFLKRRFFLFKYKFHKLSFLKNMILILFI